MCGIFGISTTAESKLDRFSLAKDLFLYSEIRGKESSGYSIKQNSNIKTVKSNLRAKYALRDHSFNSDLHNLNNDQKLSIVGHSRMVTKWCSLLRKQPTCMLQWPKYCPQWNYS